MFCTKGVSFATVGWATPQAGRSGADTMANLDFFATKAMEAELKKLKDKFGTMESPSEINTNS